MVQTSNCVIEMDGRWQIRSVQMAHHHHHRSGASRSRITYSTIDDGLDQQVIQPTCNLPAINEPCDHFFSLSAGATRTKVLDHSSDIVQYTYLERPPAYLDCVSSCKCLNELSSMRSCEIQLTTWHNLDTFRYL